MKRMFVLSSIFALFTVASYAQNASMTVVGTDMATGFVKTWGLVFAVLGAAFATFAGGYGSSVGVGIAGEVGNAVLTEDSKKFGSVLVLQALPMTQGVYGLFYAFMVIVIINANADPDVNKSITLVHGLQLFFASLPVGICGLVSGIWQGKVSAAGMQLIARRPKQMGQAMMLPAMVETFAVFGLLASILLMNLGNLGQ